MSAAAGIAARLRSAGCVFAEEEATLLLGAGPPDEVEALVRRRMAGEPLEHLLGWAAFCGMRVLVGPGVFVPRRRTELLVREAATACRTVRAAGRRRPAVLDLCCGSGAVGLAVAAVAGPVELHSADVDPAAVDDARRNLAAVGAAVYAGDLFAPLPAGLRGRVDVLVLNAPYVPTDELTLLPPEARLHEARVALDGGTDGLDVHRRVVADAPDWLAPGGALLTEVSARQAAVASRLLADHGLASRVVTDGDLGATVVRGLRPDGE